MNKNKISWEMGGEKLILENNTIDVIKRKNVRIYPYLMIDKYMNYDEMLNFAKRLSKNLNTNGFNSYVYDKNTYTYELNGDWNIVMSIKYLYNETYYHAMFTIINCIHSKIYICPFYNIEYTSLNHHPINYSISSKEFEILKKEVNKLEKNIKIIHSF